MNDNAVNLNKKLKQRDLIYRGDKLIIFFWSEKYDEEKIVAITVE